MTKTEAIALLRQGKKVRHRFFSDHEWIKIGKSGKIETEEGYLLDWGMFWGDRQGGAWELCWDEVE